MPLTRWPHQERAREETRAAIDAGVKRVLVCCATGGGKTQMMIDQMEIDAQRGWKSVQYTNRTWLLNQTKQVLEGDGINVGIRASGYDTAYLRDVQLCMTQTEYSQAIKREARELHDARVVYVDEAHLQKGGMMEEITAWHIARGATIVGYTATPLDLGSYYDQLLLCGLPSELRECGALLPCHTYAPDEPDLRHIRRQASGEYSEGDVRKVVMTQHIFGSVYENWKRLNPDALPALLFAPGVKESLWFAQQFREQGVRAAHVDGEDAWIDGELHKSDRETRERILKEHRDGELAIICNRFVMREGLNLPWCYHGIFATVFGGLASFIQSGGRLLRSFSGMDHVIAQDHGGNWHRHGSLNEDRHWELGQTNYVVSEEREEKFRDKKEREPIVCPRCQAVRKTGKVCFACGFQHEKSVRMVVQKDGELRAVEGDVYRERRVKQNADTEQIWTQCYFRAKKSKNEMTFRQAEGLFFYENHYWPPRTLKYMPKNSKDWFRKVKDVHAADLTGVDAPKQKPAELFR